MPAHRQINPANPSATATNLDVSIGLSTAAGASSYTWSVLLPCNKEQGSGAHQARHSDQLQP